MNKASCSPEGTSKDPSSRADYFGDPSGKKKEKAYSSPVDVGTCEEAAVEDKLVEDDGWGFSVAAPVAAKPERKRKKGSLIGEWVVGVPEPGQEDADDPWAFLDEAVKGEKKTYKGSVEEQALPRISESEPQSELATKADPWASEWAPRFLGKRIGQHTGIVDEWPFGLSKPEPEPRIQEAPPVDLFVGLSKKRKMQLQRKMRIEARLKEGKETK